MLTLHAHVLPVQAAQGSNIARTPPAIIPAAHRPPGPRAPAGPMHAGSRPRERLRRGTERDSVRAAFAGRPCPRFNLVRGEVMLVRWLRGATITICGLIALVSPVVLWTAWSTTVFYAVLAVGCGAILLIYLLISFADEDF
jgi:hypothetical protein